MGRFDQFRKKPATVLDALQQLPKFRKQKGALRGDERHVRDADDMPNGEGEYGEAAARRSFYLCFRIKMWDLA